MPYLWASQATRAFEGADVETPEQACGVVEVDGASSTVNAKVPWDYTEDTTRKLDNKVLFSEVNVNCGSFFPTEYPEVIN